MVNGCPVLWLLAQETWRKPFEVGDIIGVDPVPCTWQWTEPICLYLVKFVGINCVTWQNSFTFSHFKWTCQGLYWRLLLERNTSDLEKLPAENLLNVTLLQLMTSSIRIGLKVWSRSDGTYDRINSGKLAWGFWTGKDMLARSTTSRRWSLTLCNAPHFIDCIQSYSGIQERCCNGQWPYFQGKQKQRIRQEVKAEAQREKENRETEAMEES